MPQNSSFRTKHISDDMSIQPCHFCRTEHHTFFAKTKKIIPKNDFSWWFQAESNRRHKDFQSFALPTELQNQWLRGKDLNQRPPGYGPDELPGCSTSRCDMREYGGGAGIRTLAPVSRPTGFQDRTLQPLGYSSIVDPEGLEPSTNRL